MFEKPVVIEKEGILYLRIICPKCGNELLFKLHDEERRVHFACAKCGNSLETCVPALKDAKKYKI